MRSRCTATREQPRLPCLEKACVQPQRLSTADMITKIITFKNKEKKRLPLTHLTRSRGRATRSCSAGPQASVSSPPQLPGGKEPTCQCKRYKKSRFRPWVGKISRSRAWQHIPVFLPGESHGQQPDRL